MLEKQKLIDKLKQAAELSNKELINNPQASTGKCVLRSSGYSECKDGLTESACKNQASYGITATWYIGETC